MYEIMGIDWVSVCSGLKKLVVEGGLGMRGCFVVQIYDFVSDECFLVIDEIVGGCRVV